MIYFPCAGVTNESHIYCSDISTAELKLNIFLLFLKGKDMSKFTCRLLIAVLKWTQLSHKEPSCQPKHGVRRPSTPWPKYISCPIKDTGEPMAAPSVWM